MFYPLYYTGFIIVKTRVVIMTVNLRLFCASVDISTELQTVIRDWFDKSLTF